MQFYIAYCTCKYSTYISTQEIEEYGIDWDEVGPAESCVEIPMTQNPLSLDQYSLLCDTFNPLCDGDGVDIYCAVREYVCSILSE